MTAAPSAHALAAMLYAHARTDVETFAALAVRDERTGAPVLLAPHHRAMLRAWIAGARTVSLAPSEFAKSTMLAAFIAWRIGRDPSLRVGLLSATREQAVRLLRLVAIIMHGGAFGRVFPGVAVDRLTADELTVTGRPPTMKDSNVLAGAFDLSSMLGARFDLAACDDVVSRDHIRTPAGRDAAMQGFLTLLSHVSWPKTSRSAIGVHGLPS